MDPSYSSSHTQKLIELAESSICTTHSDSDNVAPSTPNNSSRKHDLQADLVRAYRQLTDSQLNLFCSLRSLSLTGDLALTLANYDLTTYGLPRIVPQSPKPSTSHFIEDVANLKPKGPDLPMELIAEILDHIGDWELSTAVGVTTSLHLPLEWSRATPMDHAILSGRTRKLNKFLTEGRFTKAGANAAVRFGYINIIEHLQQHHKHAFDEMFGKDAELIPLKASQYGRTQLLSWWKTSADFTSRCEAEFIDGASKAGSVLSLHWWHKHSGVPMQYTEAALEGASLKGHTSVLDWWKESGLSLKIGKVMENASMTGQLRVLDWWIRSGLEQPKYEKQALFHASCHGHVAVLQWWLDSGLQMIFDADVLIVATRMNRLSVLDWWVKSGLPVPYRLCDIEEALEDAIGGGAEARAWWRERGVDFRAGDAEWMKTRLLNE